MTSLTGGPECQKRGLRQVKSDSPALRRRCDKLTPLSKQIWALGADRDVPAPQRFSLVLIKPSHYDDDGYVIQWLRSAVPSNSLAVMNGLALDCKERRVLGDDVEIAITSMDEDNARIRPRRIVREFAGGRGLVVLVGVQS